MSQSYYILILSCDQIHHILHIQSTPHNRVTLVSKYFDLIKRNLGVDPIKRSEFNYSYGSWPSDPKGGPSLTSDPIKRSRLY